MRNAAPAAKKTAKNSKIATRARADVGGPLDTGCVVPDTLSILRLLPRLAVLATWRDPAVQQRKFSDSFRYATGKD